MPSIKRADESRELQRLIAIFLKAETDIINEIGRLRSLGNVDYHAVAALERVQAILRSMESESWTYVPRMIEREFYVKHPELRRIEGETVEKHIRAYANAYQLTFEQMDIVQRLTESLMGEIVDAEMTVMTTLHDALIGRVEPDIYRRVGLEQVVSRRARGEGAYKELPEFVKALQSEGVTAFVDKAGRRWSLHTYCAMVSRTTSRQADTLATLTADPEHDLYRISSHGTTCRLCAPYEGRVYSKSGTDPRFPPLADAFGKIDPDGVNTLANSWLNIHPNCLHSIYPYTLDGKSAEDIEKVKNFSDPATNPYSKDPRTEKERTFYREKMEARRHWLERYRQWERYRITLGDQVPKTFDTFQKHKLADDAKYHEWQRLYREANDESRDGESD